MLNLFSYGEEDEDEYGLRFCVQCSEKSIKEQKEAAAIPEQTNNSKKKEKSSNAASEKKSKKRKVLNTEKITGVSMDELMKEEEEEEKPSTSQAANSKLSSVSKPLNLPNPKKSVNGSSKEDNGDSAVPISDKNGELHITYNGRTVTLEVITISIEYDDIKNVPENIVTYVEMPNDEDATALKLTKDGEDAFIPVF